MEAEACATSSSDGAIRGQISTSSKKQSEQKPMQFSHADKPFNLILHNCIVAKGLYTIESTDILTPPSFLRAFS